MRDWLIPSVLILLLSACSPGNGETLAVNGGVGSDTYSQFNWGDACSAGDGQFIQFIGHFINVKVGDIPVNKANVEIYLNSGEDVDVRLIDKATGHAIIQWPDGDLNGPGNPTSPNNYCATYEGVEYCYSGYNGDGTRLGNEWIKIRGVTNRELTMSAFGYVAGQATVNYKWETTEDCVDAGAGAFAQWLSRRRTLLVGDIPAGKSNIDVALTAQDGKDIDIQLFDGDTKIVAWSADGSHGLLNGPTQRTTNYENLRVTYSGYNGRDGDWGKEYIRISGTLQSTLTVKVYGYQSGYADVVYSWGHGKPGDSCGGRTAIPQHACLNNLLCKGSGLVADIPGTCRAADWCESGVTAENDCTNLSHPQVLGFWGCEDSKCAWQSGTSLPQVISLNDLLTDPTSYENKLVTVTSVIHRGFPMCTKMMCPASNPCCNNCNASMKFKAANQEVSLNGLNCYGNQCNVLENCPYQNNTLVSVTGHVRIHTFNAETFVRIEILNSEAITCTISNSNCPNGFVCQSLCSNDANCPDSNAGHCTPASPTQMN